MADLNTGQIRNVVLVGHNGAGKTSLADALFFTSGGTTRQGNVDEKTSLSDFEPEEQRRGSSIQLAVLPCSWKDHRIDLKKEFTRRGEVSWEEVIALRILHMPGVDGKIYLDDLRLEKE